MSDRERYNRLRKRVKIVRVFFVIGLITTLMVIGLPIVLICISMLGKLNEEMKVLYKKIFVEDELKKTFENVDYKSNKGFSRNEITSFGLCKEGNTYKSEDYLSASYKGVPFKIADVTVDHVDDNTARTYFRGRMMCLDIPDKKVAHVQVYSKAYKHRPESGILNSDSKVELESIRFNELFDVYTEIQQDAFYFLTPLLIDKLVQLQDKCESILINVKDGRVMIGLIEKFNNAFDSNALGSLSDEQEIAKVHKDIEDITNIISVIVFGEL